MTNKPTILLIFSVLCLSAFPSFAKTKKMKANVSISDPSVTSAPPVLRKESQLKDVGLDLSAALVGASAKSQAISQQTDLPVNDFSPLALSSLEKLVKEKQWDVLSGTIEFWLMARKDLNWGERLRLEMIRSLALAYQGRGHEGLMRLEFFKKYLDLTLASLRYPKDIVRVQNLKAHLLLTEYDINQLKDLSR